MKAKTIILDCDGVLTDNIVHFTHQGERIKGFHSRDIRAIRELIAQGFEVIILTQSSWPGAEHFAERTGAVVEIHRDKADWVQRSVQGPYIAVGDDIPDIPILRGAEAAFAPHDADTSLRSVDGVVFLPVKGGQGVIAELVKQIL